MTREIWKAVVGFEGRYEVSNLGRVRSLTRYVKYVSRSGAKFKRLRRGRVMALGDATNDYLSVSLRDGKKTHQFLVHRLVLTTFRRPPVEDEESLHGNGIRWDNRLSNLKWGDASTNQKMRVDHGTDARGEKCVNAKLTVADVLSIRRRAARARTCDLAREYGCSPSNICRIKARRSWAHV